MLIDAGQAARKDVHARFAGTALLPFVSPVLTASNPSSGKLLIVVAHPDDEYACAATTYRLVRQTGWTADQVIVTDGESGYRYSALAEAFYGISLTSQGGDSKLASIRKQEAARAGQVLGIRSHHFLDQKDLGFGTDAAIATTTNWDRAYVRHYLLGLLQREQYDLILTLLPTDDTHGHHREATVLALEAVASLPEDQRPLVLGAAPMVSSAAEVDFSGLLEHPLTSPIGSSPVIRFNRRACFGYRDALSYQIVVNWMIAEHKSQGLFQNHAGEHESEHFWLFAVSGHDAAGRVKSLQSLLCPAIANAAAD